MTAADPAATPTELAWQAYQAEARQAREDYQTAQRKAQDYFQADIKPAMDAYHSAERAAWQAYNMTSRAAKRRYLDVVTQLALSAETPPPPLPAAEQYTPDSPDRGPWAPRPAFTPNPGSHPYDPYPGPAGSEEYDSAADGPPPAYASYPGGPVTPPGRPYPESRS